MTNIALKWQITLVDSFKYDDDHEVELTHDNEKVNWHVTVKGEFYTEFTFGNEKDARDQYILSKKATNIYMDSLMTGIESYTTPKISEMVRAMSPDAKEFEAKCTEVGDILGVPEQVLPLEMSDAEVAAYEEGR